MEAEVAADAACSTSTVLVGTMTLTQGLTLVHFLAQPEPFLTQNEPCEPPNTP